MNRNKRSIALDLSTSEGGEAAKKLALAADIVVENFAPGTMERFGLGYDTLAAQQPRLIYASVTGFGRGAGATLPGYDFLIQAMGGLMSITGTADGPPTKAGVAVVDVLAGQNLVAGVLAALYHRERTGLGQRVDVDLLSSLLAGLVNQASAYLNADVVPGRLGNAHPSVAPYQTLTAQDGQLVVAVGSDAQFARLAAVLDAECPDQPPLGNSTSFRTNRDRVENLGQLTAELESRLRRFPAAHWIERLTAVSVPCGVVNTIEGGFNLAESLGLTPVVDLDGARSVALPITLSRTPATYRLPPPPLPPRS